MYCRTILLGFAVNVRKQCRRDGEQQYAYSGQRVESLVTAEPPEVSAFLPWSEMEIFGKQSAAASSYSRLDVKA